MQDVNAALHKGSVVVVDEAACKTVGRFVAFWQKRDLRLGLENAKFSHALLQAGHDTRVLFCPMLESFFAIEKEDLKSLCLLEPIIHGTVLLHLVPLRLERIFNTPRNMHQHGTWRSAINCADEAFWFILAIVVRDQRKATHIAVLRPWGISSKNEVGEGDLLVSMDRSEQLAILDIEVVAWRRNIPKDIVGKRHGLGDGRCEEANE
ncbi:hypothetical protein HG531_008791 [Fusarium graminearum]|nr:hypothetical protein HG531_008791 [Fusarium graminearum]